MSDEVERIKQPIPSEERLADIRWEVGTYLTDYPIRTDDDVSAPTVAQKNAYITLAKPILRKMLTITEPEERQLDTELTQQLDDWINEWCGEQGLSL